jgi:hypothetical protein
MTDKPISPKKTNRMTPQEYRKAVEEAAEARRPKFEEEHSELLCWLRGKVYGEPNTKRFLEAMAGVANTKASFTERQLEILQGIKKQEEDMIIKREKSQHIGKVGDTVNLVVTLERVNVFETNYGKAILFGTMRTDDFNCVTSSIPHTYQKSTRLRIEGKVKDHVEYRGEKQTKLIQCKIEALENNENTHE